MSYLLAVILFWKKKSHINREQKYFYFIYNHKDLRMECVCLWNPAHLFQPGVILDHNPHFLFTMIFSSPGLMSWTITLLLKTKRSCATPVNSLQCSGVPQCTDWETNVLGWPESSFGFLVRCHRKAQTDFLASPIFTKFLLLTPLHRISQVLQSHSQSCSVSYQIKAPEGAAKWLHVFTRSEQA